MRVPNRAQVRRSPRVNVRNFYAWDVGSSTLPALTLSPDCPGKLRQVQEWSKVASAAEIGRY